MDVLHLEVSNHCIGYSPGHQVDPHAGVRFLDSESEPVQVKWLLGTQTIEIVTSERTLLYFHHSPATIARALNSYTGQSPRLNAQRYLQVFTGGNSFKIFALSTGPLQGCVFN